MKLKIRKKINPKKRCEVTNIEESVSPLLWFNRILGLMVFEVPAGRPWPKLSILYVFTRSIIYCFLMWYGNTFVVEIHDAIPIKPTVFNVILFVNVILSFLSTILGLVNYKNVKGYLERIALIDETLEIFGIDPEYSESLKETVKMLCIWCIAGLSIFSSDLAIGIYVFGNILEAIIKVIVFEFPLLLNPTIDLNYIVLLSILNKRFQRLNALIQSTIITPLQMTNSANSDKYENILKRNQSKIAVKPNYYYKNRSNIELILRSARQLHLELCAISRQVNDTCSRQMSLQMVSTFLLSTGFSYCFYLVYNDPNLPLSNKIQHYFSLSIWIIVSMARLIFVVRTSVCVIAEAEKTGQITHEIQIPQTQQKLKSDIRQLSLQIMQHPLSFTASGLVVLDFGYIRGFVGTVITYLMILIQNQPDVMKAATTLANSASDNSSTIGRLSTA